MKEFLDEIFEEYFGICFHIRFEGKSKKIKLTLFISLLLTEVLTTSSIVIFYSLNKSFKKAFMDIKYFSVSIYLFM